ncbi:MAG: cytochrome P460 family protein [Gammaproteobacteria bacterium]
MKQRVMYKLATAGITLTILCVGSITAHAEELARETYTKYVDEKGDIKLPDGFRLSWTHLGSWVVADRKAPGYGFHDVYTQPEAARKFLETGIFPDGAVLVKEIRKLGTEKLTTGDAVWAKENAVWFVMVKDAVGRFKGNSHWGEGWGWALHEAKAPLLNVSKGYKETCLACLTPAKKTDWVFVNGYPTLAAQSLTH